ncbi:hypothetical protein GJ496_011769 [Pomphorhynchus laevis]|nr:hypothetical protein GJ496_011769 [Pomphorhynchus laevis]
MPRLLTDLVYKQLRSTSTKLVRSSAEVRSLRPSEILEILQMRSPKEMKRKLIVDTSMCQKLSKLFCDQSKMSLSNRKSNIYLIHLQPATTSLTHSMISRITDLEDSQRTMCGCLLIESDRRYASCLQVLANKFVSKFPVYICQQDPVSVNLSNLCNVFPDLQSDNSVLMVLSTMQFGSALKFLINNFRAMNSGTGIYCSSMKTELICLMQMDFVVRLLAPICDKSRTRLATISQALTDVKRIASSNINGSSFFPSSKTDGCFVKFEMKTSFKPILDFDGFLRLVNFTFTYKNKSLKKVLQLLLNDSYDVCRVLDNCQVDGNMTACEISSSMFINLSQYISSIKN